MRARLLLVVVAVAMLVAGCTPPNLEYVAAKGMFFALPKAWAQVPSKQLLNAEQGWTDDAGQVFSQSVQWQGAWSAGGADATAVFAAKAQDQPIVFGYVRNLLQVEQQGIAEDIPSALQDVVIPASTLTQDELQTERLKRGDFRGIHQFATYPAAGALQTTEVVSMLSPGKDRVYVLLVRCSDACFSENGGTINAIFDSLTFREQRG